MPRRTRISLAGLPLHIIQRGNSRTACFLSVEDHRAYLHWLRRYADGLGVRIHAYALMTNHVHLLLTPARPEHASRLMRALGRHYVRYVNEKYARSGTLWEGRFRACGVHAKGSHVDKVKRSGPTGARRPRAARSLTYVKLPRRSDLRIDLPNRQEVAMRPNWMSWHRAPILVAIGLLAVERIASQLFAVDLLPSLGTGSGLLMLWGVGHCDTLDGPLVELARKAVAEKNVNLVLPWVRPQDEPEVRHAFEHAQAVRDLGPKARSLADTHFFETLVRIHRAGEGAPFEGLKPAGLDLGPAVPAADRALETGSPDAVIKLLTDAVSAGVRARFRAAMERKAFERNDVAAGREYVEAYVPYVHYVERLWDAATAAVHGHYAGHEPQAHADAHAVHHH